MDSYSLRYKELLKQQNTKAGREEEVLVLNNEQIAFIHPFIQTITNLRDFQFINGRLAKLENIRRLSNLRSINLSNNNLKDISELRFLPNITEIILDNNPISRVHSSTFSHLHNLETLSLVHTNINHAYHVVAALAQNKNLKRLLFQRGGRSLQSAKTLKRRTSVTSSASASSSSSSDRLSHNSSFSSSFFARIKSNLDKLRSYLVSPGENERPQVAQFIRSMFDESAEPSSELDDESLAILEAVIEPKVQEKQVDIAVSGPTCLFLQNLPSIAVPESPYSLSPAAGVSDDSLIQEPFIIHNPDAIPDITPENLIHVRTPLAAVAPPAVSTPASSSSLPTPLPRSSITQPAATASTGAPLPPATPLVLDFDEEDEEDWEDMTDDEEDDTTDESVESFGHIQSLDGSEDDDDDEDHSQVQQNPPDQYAFAHSGIGRESEAENLERRRQGRPVRTPVITFPYYRAFFIHFLPTLVSLDNEPIDAQETLLAEEICAEKFESVPYNRPPSVNAARALRLRELGASDFISKKQLPTPLASKPPISSPSHSHPHPSASNRTLISAQVSALQRGFQPFYQQLGPSILYPRQFEYNPNRPDWMAIGTTDGRIYVLNHECNEIVASTRAGSRPDTSMLALCWMRFDSSKFIAGGDDGTLLLFDVERMQEGKKEPIYSFPMFPRMTSAHVNSTDEYLLTSGYSDDVGLYDLREGKVIKTLNSLHTGGHVNVLKWANQSPTLFATSSFDKYIKLWDLRTNMSKPVFAQKSVTGNVMVCWSPDDKYLLSSANDNEVRMYDSTDGRFIRQFGHKRLNSSRNFTRSYWMNGSQAVLCGSCEEQVVRVFNSSTGALIREVDFMDVVPEQFLPFSYIQSLRGDPTRDFSMSCLVAFNSREFFSPSHIVKVDLMESVLHDDLQDLL